MRPEDKPFTPARRGRSLPSLGLRPGWSSVTYLALALTVLTALLLRRYPLEAVGAVGIDALALRAIVQAGRLVTTPDPDRAHTTVVSFGLLGCAVVAVVGALAGLRILV